MRIEHTGEMVRHITCSGKCFERIGAITVDIQQELEVAVKFSLSNWSFSSLRMNRLLISIGHSLGPSLSDPLLL